MKLLVLACLVGAAVAEEYVAIVLLQGGGNFVHGNLTFKQIDDGPVRITGTVTGISSGQHGFHIHEKGDITGGCLSTGGHFNPYKHPHGAPEDEARHVGDLGNVNANANQVAIIDIEDNVITLCSGPNNVIGRAVVIHSGVDDLGKGGATDSLTTGHAGSRLTCGVIGIKSPTGSWSKNSAPSTYASLFATALTAFSIIFLKF